MIPSRLGVRRLDLYQVAAGWLGGARVSIGEELRCDGYGNDERADREDPASDHSKQGKRCFAARKRHLSIPQSRWPS